MRSVFLAALLLCLAIAGASAEPFHRAKIRGALGDINRAAGAPWLNRALRDVGRNPTGWTHKWCGRYLDMITPGKGSNLAIAWRSYGRPTHARPGAIAVMNGHVGIVKEVHPAYVVLVSGNHSGKSGRRTVGIGRYSKSRIVAYRWPA